MTTTLPLRVQVEADRGAMGRAAAGAIATAIQTRLALQSQLRMVFAAAPSQLETLTALAATPGVDWSRITAFHMDEYLDVPEDSPQRFGNWLRATLFDQLPFGAVHLIEPGEDPWRAARRYAAELATAPIDLVCLGIGDNGHLAFNDPPVADLNDPQEVKVVELDDACRRQQVNDGCFATLAEVPTRAITLTVPRLMAAEQLFCVAPGARKRESVRRALTDPISAACPATALRTHPSCRLFLDQESAAGLEDT
ncbi:glucosamine-6-phosphate deaminase [Kribbella sp. NBC_01245]|uniref:glucosamine-6-phosphate deaminase n=1 Tax=Kribbella sp. NBC_01245 TaxID=2903578 RepID=UPI002E2AB876|nr:glucosamine-6-phosphate deaminase [Kribbella sp. NBC_01245]